MRYLRLTVNIVLLFLLLLGLSIVSLFFLINPNKMRSVIASQIHDATGLRAEIEKISWSFYPAINFKIKKINLIDPHSREVLFKLLNNKIIISPNQLIHLNRKLKAVWITQEFHYGNSIIENLTSHINWNRDQHHLKISPINASIYQGQIRGSFVGSLDHFIWKGFLNFSNLDMKRFSNLCLPNSKLQLKGNANSTVVFESRGQTVNDVIKNLSGTIQFSSTDGAVLGIDFKYLMESAQSLILKEEAPKSNQENQTVFNSLKGQGIIKDGLMQYNLALNSQLFTTEGHGVVNFSDNKMNLKLNIIPIHRNNSMLQIPIIIKGPLNNLSIGLDMNEINQIAKNIGIQKVKNKTLDILREHFTNSSLKIGDNSIDNTFLQKLLGR